MNTDYKDIFAMAGPLARALPDYAYRPEQALMAKAVGAALARVAWSSFIRAASEIANTGSFEEFGNAAPSDELADIFRKRV